MLGQGANESISFKAFCHFILLASLKEYDKERKPTQMHKL